MKLTKRISKFVNTKIIDGISIGDVMFVIGMTIMLGRLQGWF